MFKHVIIIIVLFLLQACATSAEQSQRSEKNTVETTAKFVGELDGLKYTNSFVPAQLMLPNGWFLKLPDNQYVAIDDSAELIALEPLVRKSYRLLYLFKYKKAPVGELNTSMIFSVVEGASIKSLTAEAYNQGVQALLVKSGKGFRFDRKPENKKIAGQNFNVMYSELTLKGVKIFQEFQTANIGDRLLTFILTYTNDKSRKDLAGIMKTLSIQ